METSEDKVKPLQRSIDFLEKNTRNVLLSLFIGICVAFGIYDIFNGTQFFFMFGLFLFPLSLIVLGTLYYLLYYSLKFLIDLRAPKEHWSHLKTISLTSMFFAIGFTTAILVTPINENIGPLFFIFTIFLTIIIGYIVYQNLYLGNEDKPFEYIQEVDSDQGKSHENIQEPNSEEEKFEIQANYNSDTDSFDDLGLPINLKQDEFIIQHEDTHYNETRSEYRSGMRKTKYTPSISGQNVKVWKIIDRGKLILTNNRLVFIGSTKNRDYNHKQIRNVKIFIEEVGLIFKKKIPKGIIIQTSKYARNHLYSVGSPFLWVNLMSQIYEIEEQIFNERDKVISNLNNISSSTTGNVKTNQKTECHACGQRTVGKYCTNCGSIKDKLMTKCPNCSILVNSPFCPSCGHHIDQEVKIPDWEKMSGQEFEEFVSILLKKMGYKNIKNSPYTQDGGIDIEIEEIGALTKTKIGVECKNWLSNTVGREVIQKLDSAINYNNFNKGLVITSGTFSKEAIEYAKNVNISLIDGERLNEIVLQYLN